jgi:hypothetical protein
MTSPVALRRSAGTSQIAVAATLALAAGLAIGALTSFGQGHLDGALNAFVNSASAWLVAPFLLGTRMRTWGGAAAVGFLVCLSQLVGYAATSELRGFTYGGAIVVFWAVCAVVGGPVFGAAGRAWRTGTGDLRGLGGGVLASAFLAEGLWIYLHELHYYATAALWIGIGLVLALAMTRGWRERRWLPLIVAIGVLAEVVLTAVYAQSF